MSSGPILTAGDAGAFRALGDGGEPVWRRAAQLRAAIDTRLGKRHAELFAIPHDQAGRIEWQAAVDGTPRAWAALSEPEKQALRAKVQELRPDLERLVERLDTAGRSDGERAFGRLLRQALVTPGPETLYSVDTRPVLAFWGFSPEDSPGFILGIAPVPAAAPAWSAAAASAQTSATKTGWTAVPTSPAATTGAAPGGWAPQPGPPPTVEPSPPSPGGWPGTAVPPPYAAVTAAAPPPSPSGWWWKGLLVGLVLLTVLGVSAYFLRPYLPLWVWDGTAVLPPTAAGGPTAPGTASVDDSALRAEKAREVALRTDVARLWAQFADKRNQCAPGPQGSVVPGPGGTVVPGPKGPDGKPVDRETQPGETGIKPPTEARRPPDPAVPPIPDGKPADPKAGPKTAERPPEAKPPAPPDPKGARPPETAVKPPETKAAPPPVDPKIAPKPAERPPEQATRPPAKPPGQPPGQKTDDKPIDRMQIPRDPGVGFMQGEWRSSTDLTTQGGDDVIRPQYTFDKDGKGKSRIVQKNGVTCEGPAQASRDPSGKLVIQETDTLKCSDGTSYAPSTVTCENGQDGRAQCQGRTESGPSYAVELGK